MKRLFWLVPALASALSGCRAYCELSHDLPAFARIDGGETPIATYYVCNVSYRLLGFIPWTTGETWKSGPYEEYHDGGIRFFRDDCTLDDNLASVRHALAEVGSNRLGSLVTVIEENSAWSLFLMSRRVMKTTCLIVKPKTTEEESENDDETRGVR